jgi:hypothetical protein
MSRSGPPLWSSGQSSWLQIRRPGFDSRDYQKKKVVGLERGPLSLVSTTEELLERKSSGSCLENREYGRRDPSRWPRGTLYPQKLTITSPTSCGRSVGIVRSRGLRSWSCFFYVSRSKKVIFFLALFLYFLSSPFCFPIRLSLLTPFLFLSVYCLLIFSSSSFVLFYVYLIHTLNCSLHVCPLFCFSIFILCLSCVHPVSCRFM